MLHVSTYANSNSQFSVTIRKWPFVDVDSSSGFYNLDQVNAVYMLFHVLILKHAISYGF